MTPHVQRYRTRRHWFARWNAWMGYAIEATDDGRPGLAAYWLGQCAGARREMAAV